jgi:hypothetical protein
LLGIENGDLYSPDSYQAPHHKAFNGRGLAILQSTTAGGQVTVKATSPNLESSSIDLETSK